MQREAEARLSSSSLKKGTQQTVDYRSPEERVREMEKEAAGTTVDPLPNTMELFSPSKVRPWERQLVPIKGVKMDGSTPGWYSHPCSSFKHALIAKSWGQGGAQIHPMCLIHEVFL
jgi:hypothetical protein